MPNDQPLSCLGDLTMHKNLATVHIRRNLGCLVSLEDEGTTVLDLDGSELFRRFPVKNGPGFADVTSRRDVGNLLVTFAEDLEWNETRVLCNAEYALAMQPWGPIDRQATAFVAYNFPHVAVRFQLVDGGYVYIDTVTFQRVADGGLNSEGLRGRTDLGAPLSVMLGAAKKGLEAHFNSQVAAFKRLATPAAKVETKCTGSEAEGRSAQTDAAAIQRARSKPKIIKNFPYDPQITEVWCVPACIQMVLRFYHYGYGQAELAAKIGLGTLAWPQELQCSRQEFKVLRTLEEVSRNALSVEMSVCGSSFWTEFTKEIDAQRPVVVLGGGHARVVVGYSEVPVPGAQYPARMLLLFDPEPLTCNGYRQWVAPGLMDFDVAFFAELRKYQFQTATALDGAAVTPPGAPGASMPMPMPMPPGVDGALDVSMLSSQPANGQAPN